MTITPQLQIIAALAIIALIGLAVWAYRSAQKAQAQGYDLGYDDAKRGHELRLNALQEEAASLARTVANQHTAHRLERDAIIQDADARIAIYAARALTSIDIQNLRIANKQLLLAAQTYTNLKLHNQARFAANTAQALGQIADRSAAALPDATPATDDILTLAANVSPNGKSWLVHGPQACGKTRNSSAIAAALGLTDILDDWQPGDRVPTTKTLVLTNASGPFHPFMRRVLSFDQAMSLVTSKKGVAA